MNCFANQNKKLKKIVLLLVIISFSCAKKAEIKTDSKVKLDISKESEMVGNDADEHGCKPSTGYQWSVLKNECVKVFSIGIRLNHAVSQEKSYESSAFVIFDEGKKAELFLDNGEKPFILERKSADKTWINGDWELSIDKDYILKKKGKILYSSK